MFPLLFLLLVLAFSSSGVNAVAGPWVCDDSDGCQINNPLALETGSVLTEPAVIDTTVTTSFTITVEQCTETVVNYATWTTRCYCYLGACSVPGPTLLIKGGNDFNLTLQNDLPTTKGSVDIMNKMHSPNTINVHTHGLHIAPEVDNIFVVVSPGGGSHTYDYVIPADHPPGLHWYHSHYHGSSALQVMSGLVGAIIVAPPDDFTTPDSITAMTATTLVFTHIDLSETSNGRSDPFSCWSYRWGLLSLMSISASAKAYSGLELSVFSQPPLS
jgi:FtsP/CotA-like multicopper oxidase with cupredoxin domain